MVTIHSLVISIFPLILLLPTVDALRFRSIRQKRADECANLNGNACTFVSCENGGQCFEDSSTADCFRCQCLTGYTGKVCDTPIPILPVGCNPGCQNGGRCNVNVCECLVGYSGILCETINYCAPTNPCQNGGQCISTATTYQCDCTGTGHSGPTCTDAIPANPCASSPCQNGGVCSWNGATMNCVCVNDYTGMYCQIAPIPCVAAPCLNGGQCQLISANTYGCVCTEEYTGTRCETSILETHPCVTMPTTVCLNGGVCTVNGPNYVCKCAPGWGGTNCNIQGATALCNPNPCGAHGTCFEVSLPIGPTAYCDCDNRWTGKYCDTNMDATCPVGYCTTGTCQMVGNTPYCACPPLYTGQRCDTLIIVATTTTVPGTTPPIGTTPPVGTTPPIGTTPPVGTTPPIGTTPPLATTTPVIGGNLCSSNPCKNGGTCFGNSDTYRCECLGLWAGDTCNEFSIILTTSDPGITEVIDACSPNPCSNNGICSPFGGSFKCTCIPPYTGIGCDLIGTTIVPLTTTPTIPTACEDQPCQNGGTCVPMGNSYSCFCGVSSIYTGQNCDTTTPMPANECPLDCAPGRCVFSGNPVKPYACLWNGVMRPVDGTTG